MEPLLPGLSSWSSREEQREVQALRSNAASSQTMPCYGTAANGFSLPFAMPGFSPVLDTYGSGDCRMAVCCVPPIAAPHPLFKRMLGHFHPYLKPHVLGRNGFRPCNFRTNFPSSLNVENSFGCRAETVVSPQHQPLRLAEHVFPWQHRACKALKQLWQNSSYNRPGGVWRQVPCKTNPPLAKCPSAASDEEAAP